jgi:Tol biopolymer transport system component
VLKRFFSSALMLAACGGDPATPDAMPDAAPRCDPNAPFGAGVPVEGLSSPTLDDYGARFSSDELTVVFTRRQATDVSDLYTATRTTRDGAFSTPELLATVNSVNSDRWPTMSPDGLTLLFDSDRGTGIFHTYVSRRTSTSDRFGAATAITALMDREIMPFLASDTAMYFSSAIRLGGQGMPDIWRVDIDAAGNVGTPTSVIGGVNTPDQEEAAALTPDELRIVFRRTGGGNGADIYTAQRSTAQDGWGAATPIPGLAEPNIPETPDWLSPEGCALYFHRPGGDGTNLDLFVATRP